MGTVEKEDNGGLIQIQVAAAEMLALDEATASWAAHFAHGPGFEPKIVAFVCNWCTYTGADLAGTSRLKMAPTYAFSVCLAAAA